MTAPYDFLRPYHYCAGAFVIHKRKILFLKQDKTHYLVLPGGHVEDDELPHEAAIREVREETGLEIELLQKTDAKARTGIVEPLPLPFAMRVVPCRDKKDIDILFTSKVIGGKLEINEESTEACWLSLEEINQNPVVGPSLRYYANQILKNRGKKSKKNNFFSTGKIRFFRKTDGPACAHVVEKAIRTGSKLPKKELDFLVQTETKKFHDEKRTKENFMLVYEKAGRICGVIGLKKDELNPLYVTPAFQHKGIGTALARKLEETARKNKIKRLWLNANPDAEPFYFRLGYKKIKQKRITGTKIPIIEMKKEL